MRIIAGNARGIRLKTLDGEDTRPTLERVKEAVFSTVQFILPGARVLDLFAGSGQMGLEALSRGAAHCTFVDENRTACDCVKENVEAAGFTQQAQVLRMGAESFLRGVPPTQRYDIILIDPPYRRDILPKLLVLVEQACADGAVVLCESEKGASLPQAQGKLVLQKQYRYGTVAVSRYVYEA